MTSVPPEQVTNRRGARWHTSALDAARPSNPRSATMSALYGAIAISAIAVGSVIGKVHGNRVEPKVVLWTSSAVFVVAGIATTRRLSRWLENTINAHSSSSTARSVRVLAAIIGYTVVLFATLGLISVPLGHIAIGGAIAGVVIGIAAQQVLGNVFAGIVLLLARPFRLNDHIRIRSGALGGEFDGVVRAMNLTYVMVRTEQGLLHVPNSGMLAAAVGPWKKVAVAPEPAPSPGGDGDGAAGRSQHEKNPAKKAPA